MGKKKKTGLEGLILDEAEVDDMEDEDYDDDEDIIDHPSEVEEAAQQQQQQNQSHHRRLNRIWDNQDADEIEKYYAEKYAEQTARETSFYGHKDSEVLNDEITQTAHLPTVKDPNLWMVKCQIGTEKQCALQLMRKFLAYESMTDDPGPLQIKSVIALDSVKGYIYIESYKQTHVKQAIDGINNLRLGLHKQTMVPISEMTDVLRVVREQPKLKRDQFVRLKRSIYKNDLAQVEYIDASSNQVCLRLKPRIDYTKMRGALRSTGDKDSLKRPKSKRPAAKLFDADAIRAIGGEVTSDGEFQIFEGNRYKRGLLYKTFPMDALIIDGVKPSLNELESTEEQALDDIELQLGSEKEMKLSPGDKIEVCEGELINLHGKVLTIDGTRVTILPNHPELKDPLEFLAHELMKRFDEGDHVKVIDGRYEGDTGTIVRTDERSAILLSDLSMDEIKVLVRDLQLCPDRATGVDSLGHFNYGDLVQLDAQTVGVIVRLEKENLQILTQQGRVRPYKSQAVTKKNYSKQTQPVSLDKDSNPISIKDQVTVVDGPYKGKTAIVKHIYRSWTFLHSKAIMEHGGMFVCKARMLQVLNSSGGAAKSRGSSFAMPGMGYMSPRIASPQHPSAGKESTGVMVNANMYGGRDKESAKFIGKTIKIVSGSYKGHIGIVKDAIGLNARVELHSDPRTITVAKQNIKLVDGTRIVPSSDPYFNASKTPAYSQGTPSHSGGRTPSHHGMQTPLHESGSQTPMHSSGQTPRPDFDLDDAPSPKPPASYNTPATPTGFQPPETPDVGNSFAPQTPGLYSSSNHDYNVFSPYTAPTPSGGQFGSGTNIASPAPNSYVTPSPSFHAIPSNAGYNSFNVMTPGPTSMLQPHTPGAGLESVHEWQNPDMVVSIKLRMGSKNSLGGQIGYIKNISGDLVNIFLIQEERIVSIQSGDLVPVIPDREDRFRVIDGEFRDRPGKVIDIQGDLGICQLDSDAAIKFIPLKFLCKLKPDGRSND